MGKKKRKAPAHITKVNDERAAQKRALADDGSSCTDDCTKQQQQRNWGGRPKGATDATPRKRNNYTGLLKSGANWVSETPDPLSKKQRADDAQTFSPGEGRDFSQQVRNPFRKHTDYMRSQQLITERLDEIGRTLSVRDQNFLQAIGQLTSDTSDKEVEKLAWELSGFDLMAKEVDDLRDHVHQLECENSALHCELAKTKRYTHLLSYHHRSAIVSSHLTQPLFCCSTVQRARLLCTLRISQDM
jgi:hypothetical protein